MAGIGIALLLGLITPATLTAQPSLCTVSGVIYLPDGVTRAKNVQVIVRDVRDANNIPIIIGPAYYYSNDTGLVSFTAPRQSTLKLQVPTACLNTSGGVSVSIPNASTATLTSLQAAACTGVSIPNTAGLTVQNNDVSVSSSKFNTLDFASPLAVTETPTGEANISITQSVAQSAANYWIADGDTATIDMRTAARAFSFNFNGTRKISGDSAGTLYTVAVANSASGASLVLGSVTAASIVLTTDGTGDGEVVAPAQSIGTTELTDNAVTADKLASTAVTPGSYGTSTQVSTVVFDADGRATSASNTSISIGEAGIVWGAINQDSLESRLPDVYKIIEIPAGYFNPEAGDLTGATTLADDADNTNDITLDQLEFSASAENYVTCTISMPPDWDGTTAPKFKVVYYSSTGHGSNTVEWDIATLYVRPGTDTWKAALGSAATTNHNPTTADVWYITSALSPTPAGTAASGAQLIIRLMRDGDDGSNDTHAATAKFVKLLMQYRKNSYGSISSW